MTKQTDFAAGFEAGREWLGPNGDGSLGCLSHSFVLEQAEMRAAGSRFAELLDGPTEAEVERAAVWMDGFWAGREAARAA